MLLILTFYNTLVVSGCASLAYIYILFNIYNIIILTINIAIH